MAVNKKVKSKTVKTRNALAFTQKAMSFSKFVIPAIPMTVETFVNWEEWFANTNGNLPLGLIMSIVGTVIGVVSVMKKEYLKSNGISVIFPVALSIILVGVSFLLLANILYEAGLVFIYTGAAVVLSAVDDQLEQSLVKPKLQWYIDIVKEGGLDKKTEAEKEKREAALKEMREAKAEAKVRF